MCRRRYEPVATTLEPLVTEPVSPTLMYEYYLRKGKLPLVGTYVLNITTVLFICANALTMWLGMDWVNYREATNPNPFAYIGFPTSAKVWVYTSVVLLAALCVALGSAVYLRNVSKVAQVYAQLNIDDASLPFIDWGEIVRRYVARARVIFDEVHSLSPEHELAMTTLSEDNYVIGLLANVPWIRTYTRVVNWVFRRLVLVSFYGSTPISFRRSLIYKAIAVILATPFTLPLGLAYITFAHLQEWHFRRDMLGPRVWSYKYRYLLRRYNEYPHYVEERLAQASSAAYEYISQYPLIAQAVIARHVGILSSSILTWLLVATIVNDTSVYSGFTVAVAALVTTIFIAARSYIPAPSGERAIIPENLIPVHLQDYTIANEHKRRYAYMKDAFPHRIVEYLKEVASVVWVGWWLLRIALTRSYQLYQWLSDNTVEYTPVHFSDERTILVFKQSLTRLDP